MGQAMARILARDVASEDPVLAQRKTPMMKALEQRTQEASDLKRRRQERHAKKTVEVKATEPANLNSERALRKTATRAVVALFNAISEHQRTGDEATSYATERTTAYGEKVAAAKDVQRKTAAAIHDANAKDNERFLNKGGAALPKVAEEDDDEDLPANSWARDDYLLDAAKTAEWDDDDADDEHSDDDDAVVARKARSSKKARKDGKEHAFLYDSSTKRRRA